MNIQESIRMAFRSLGANKMRSALTMLGIIIGTGAVIALLSLGQGAQIAITEQIQSIGSNLVMIFPNFRAQGGRIEPLTYEDAEAIAKNPLIAPYLSAIAPEINRGATVTFEGASVDTSIIGTVPAFEHVRNFHPQLGEFISDGDEAAAARVAVLGMDVVRELFGDPEFALGKTIRINRIPFRVIGILEEKGGSSMGRSLDDVVIVPLSTAQRRLFSGRASSGEQRVDLINISVRDEKDIDNVIEEIVWTLRERHRIKYDEEDDFTVVSQKDILSAFNQVTDILTIFLGAIAGISLLVGGIGIMNIMLVSVTERTREIGIRKAVGAKRKDILWQFLIESIVLSFIGGILGILLGWGISAIVNSLGTFTTYVSPQAVLLAVGFSTFVGLFFGIYPASRAASLNPIEALRYE
ncbi:MAG: ABC transporter permease [Anaerolineae bacterium]|nr:ABC transporter permease [Anaerolineae bacterium]